MADPDLTCCGMPLTCTSADEIAQPVAALVIVKTLEADGGIAHRVMVTDGLGHVEALGFARFADLFLDGEIRRNIDWDAGG